MPEKRNLWAGSNLYATSLFSSNVIGLWEMYLLWRQRTAYMSGKIPEQLADVVEEEDFRATQKYNVERIAFSIFEHVKDLVIGNLSMLSRLSSKIYYFVQRNTGLKTGSISHVIAYTVAEDALMTALSIPFTYYREFVIEKRHGFSRITKTEFAKDIVKSFLLRATLLHPISTWMVVHFVEKFGENFVMYLFAGAAVSVGVFSVVLPVFVLPLFNEFTPLPQDSQLRKSINELTTELNFPTSKIFLVDGSRRSSHSNAYITGFLHFKRIAIFDTFVEQVKGDDSMIVAALCHELGHWHHGHSMQNMCIVLGYLYLCIYGAQKVIFGREIYHQFGYHEGNAAIGFEIFSNVYLAPLNTLLGYAISWFSRHNEFEADRFAVSHKFGPELRRTLILLQKENKTSLTPDPLYTALHLSHPPIIQRIVAIDEEMKKMD